MVFDMTVLYSTLGIQSEIEDIRKDYTRRCGENLFNDDSDENTNSTYDISDNNGNNRLTVNPQNTLKNDYFPNAIDLVEPAVTAIEYGASELLSLPRLLSFEESSVNNGPQIDVLADGYDVISNLDTVSTATGNHYEDSFFSDDIYSLNYKFVGDEIIWLSRDCDHISSDEMDKFEACSKDVSKCYTFPRLPDTQERRKMRERMNAGIRNNFFHRVSNSNSITYDLSTGFYSGLNIASRHYHDEYCSRSSEASTHSIGREQRRSRERSGNLKRNAFFEVVKIKNKKNLGLSVIRG